MYTNYCITVTEREKFLSEKEKISFGKIKCQDFLFLKACPVFLSYIRISASGAPGFRPLFFNVLCFYYFAMDNINYGSGKDGTGAEEEKKVQRYVDILTDAGFKAVFGDRRNSDVLIDLINVMLPDGKKVRKIEYATTEIPGFSPFNKSIRIDLRCTGEDMSSFIVEVQCYHQENFFRRCVLYAAKTYDSMALKGDGNIYDIPPVYFIGLLGRGQGCPSAHVDRTADLWADRFISEYTFREKISSDVPDDTIFFIFAELDRFSKKIDECSSSLDKWLFALKHVGTLDCLPDGLRSKAFERLFQACEIARFEPERRIAYEENMITERDYYNIINTAKNDGRAEGRAEGEAKGRAEGEAIGRAEGREEGRIEIAKSLKRLGVPMETIMQATGMSEQELRDL